MKTNKAGKWRGGRGGASFDLNRVAKESLTDKGPVKQRSEGVSLIEI